MLDSTGRRRMNHSRVAVLVLYAFVLAASAFLHNDLLCRQDSRTHCIACSVSQDAQRVEAHGGPVDALQQVAGQVVLQAYVGINAPALSFVSDRAPPA